MDSNETDKTAIIDVLLRYADSIDRKDWPRLATCFTEDATTQYADNPATTGRDAIVGRMAQRHDDLASMLHRTTNFIVNLNGDEARSSSYVDALLTPPGPDPLIFQACGRYEDRLVREADGWKIASRIFYPALMRHFKA